MLIRKWMDSLMHTPLTLMLLVVNLANTTWCKKPEKMIETLAYEHSSENTQRELSHEYQHDGVSMIFKNRFLVLWTKIASTFEGLNVSPSSHLHVCLYRSWLHKLSGPDESISRAPVTRWSSIVGPGGGGTLLQRGAGAAPALRISRKTGSFLRPPHVRDFVKEGYFFVPRYSV